MRSASNRMTWSGQAMISFAGKRGIVDEIGRRESPAMILFCYLEVLLWLTRMWSRGIKVEGMFGHERWWVTTDERLACLQYLKQVE